MNRLKEPIDLIVTGDNETLLRKYKDHALKGNLKGFRELHIDSDWLLVYRIETNDSGQEELELLLVATGSHDYIFRSG